jgi:DNA polymerase-4
LNKTGLPTATKVAIAIRQQIREELSLTASAGVAPNKFLAKIASDWRKPDGLFVIQPKDFDTFLRPLPVPRIPGVGGVTEARLKQIGIQIVGDLHSFELDAIFGWPAPFLSSGNSTFSSLPRPNIPKSGGAWHRF